MATETTSQVGAQVSLAGVVREPAAAAERLGKAGKPERQESVAREADKVAEQQAKEREEDKQSAVQQLKEMVVRLNSHPQVVNRDLLFMVDDESGSLVVKVVNADTEELIRQIPSEEALQRARFLDESTEGLIFRSKA